MPEAAISPLQFMIGLGTYAARWAGELGLLPVKPLADYGTAFWQSLFPTARLPTDVVIRLRLLGKITDEEYKRLLRYEGYSDARAERFLEAAKNYLTAGEIVAAYYREKGPGKPSDSDLQAIAQELESRGFAPEDAKRYALLAHPYPSPTDVIQWAVREAFSPKVVEDWQMDAAYPEELNEWGQAVGWTPEILKYFWRAHWRWPSPTQAQEFVWRTSPKWWKGKKFEKSHYEEMLRLADYVPGTIEFFDAVLYRPFTRVDVRRMHKLGILSDEDLVDAYKELGFDDWHAQKMAEFTIQYNLKTAEDPDRDLTRAVVEKAYRTGVIDGSQFEEFLKAMGYSDEDARFLRQVNDQDMALDRVWDWVSLLRTQVSSGLISIDEARRKLTDLGLQPVWVDHYINLFSAYKEQPTKLPSKTDVKKWVSYEIIGPEEAKDYLRRLGYSETEIQHYMEEWGLAGERKEAVQKTAGEIGEEEVE